MTTDILLGVVAGILLFGFIGVLTVLVEIRDAMAETNGGVKRLADEIVDDEPVVFRPPDEKDRLP